MNASIYNTVTVKRLIWINKKYNKTTKLSMCLSKYDCSEQAMSRAVRMKK